MQKKSKKDKSREETEMGMDLNIMDETSLICLV